MRAYNNPGAFSGLTLSSACSNLSVLLKVLAIFRFLAWLKSCFPAGGKKFSGPLQCAQDILQKEGARGLLKGWTANYIRLGPQTTVIFVVMEKLRQWHGLESL